MTTAIRTGTLLDGNGEDPVRGAVIVVEGETITGIAKDVPRGATARTRRSCEVTQAGARGRGLRRGDDRLHRRQAAGTIEVGKRADLIGVQGDPLADVTLLQKKECIPLGMKDGVAHKEPR